MLTLLKSLKNYRKIEKNHGKLQKQMFDTYFFIIIPRIDINS